MSSLIALVTGANRGIGRAVAVQLAEAGYHLVLTSRSESGRPVAKELKDKGHNVTFHQLDVDDGQSIAELAEFVADTFGRLDVLVNNAGIHYDTYQNTMTADFNIVEEAIRVNTLGPWRLSKALYPYLKAGGHGRIVNVSSSSGSFVDSWPGTPAYSISKAALNMLTVKMAADVKDDGILVNSVCPGWVRTNMGGQEAPRSPEEGAKSVVWAALIPDDGPTGGFFRDGEAISW